MRSGPIGQARRRSRKRKSLTPMPSRRLTDWSTELQGGSRCVTSAEQLRPGQSPTWCGSRSYSPTGEERLTRQSGPPTGSSKRRGSRNCSPAPLPKSYLRARPRSLLTAAREQTWPNQTESSCCMSSARSGHRFTLSGSKPENAGSSLSRGKMFFSGTREGKKPFWSVKWQKRRPGGLG